MPKVIDAQRFARQAPATTILAAPLDMETAPKSVGPFVLAAHQTVASLAPGVLPVDADVRPHPHIGLVAISYVLEGAITHRDSLGHRSELLAGDLGVTVAGRGVVHSERFERLRLLGGSHAMFQLLLALPDGAEDIEPSFFHRAVAEVPTATERGATTRWLLPAPPDLPAGLPWKTPILLADVTLEHGGAWSIPDAPARAIYVWEGEIEVGEHRVGAGQLALAESGDHAVRARAPSRLLAFGGTPVGPRWSWWNYLHSSLERIEAAKSEWREARVTLPVGDTESFTPAPPDEGRPLRQINATK